MINFKGRAVKHFLLKTEKMLNIKPLIFVVNLLSSHIHNEMYFFSDVVNFIILFGAHR